MSRSTYDMVFLADNEWGNRVMEEVAREWFTDHPDCNFVQVYEHAGWWLAWHRSEALIGTANDLAVLPADRPRSSGFSGISHRRPVTRPDIREVDTLAIYQPHKQAA